MRFNPRNIGKIIIIIALVFLAFFVIVQTSPAYQAHKIFRALEKYHEDHQKYPDELDTLMPDYLTGIPTVLGSNGSWVYFTEADEYGLILSHTEVREDIMCETGQRYSSQTKQWTSVGMCE